MRIIAHRGASAYEPENTLRAFERAIAQGADWVELDVRVSADGVAVVSHGADLSDRTNGSGLVAERDWAYIATLDAGQGQPMPSFAAVLRQLAGRCGLYVELKAVGAAGAVARELADSGADDGIVLGSFRTEHLREAAAAAPHVPRSYLSGDIHTDIGATAQALGCAFVHPCWEAEHPTPHVLLTPDLLSGWIARGLETVVWHEEREEELSRLAELPVWGICTNTPDVLRRVIASQEGSRPR